jgi:hypothetical protein
MGVPTSEVGYTSDTTGRGDHEVHKGHVVALENLPHSKCPPPVCIISQLNPIHNPTYQISCPTFVAQVVPKYQSRSEAFVCECFISKIRFHGEDFLAPRPTSKLEEHPLSAVSDCLFNIFAANLHIGDLSFIRNLRTRHELVTGTQKSSINTTNLNITS